MRAVSPTRLTLATIGFSCGLFLLVGCNALIGIEDLSSEGGDASAGQGPDDKGGGKDGGTSGKGGSAGKDSVDRDGGSGSGGTGGGGKGGAGGKSGSGAGGTAESGSGGDGEGGSAAGSGGSDANAGTNDDAGTNPGDPTVHGKVIDYYRNPVPDVAVQIGDATTMTDAQGKFTIEDVADTYDTSLTINAKEGGGNRVTAWQFIGVTRRDPTFQIYRGLPQTSGGVDIKIQNVTFPVPSDNTIAVAFSTDGQYHTELDAMETNILGASWEGPPQVSGTAHALYWSNASTTPYLPTAYLARDDHPIALDENAGANLEVDLSSSGNLPTGLVSGMATGASFGDRDNAIFLRYDDDAVIPLAEDTSGSASYSFLVPSLPNTSLVVAAGVGDSFRSPFAVAYADAVTPGTSGISLAVPTPATPLMPGGGTSNVTPDTDFTWSGSNQVYMVRFDSRNFLETYYVITTAKKAHIPAPPVTNLPLAANAEYTWSVRTHNHYDTVDDATGPEGFLDAYCYGEVSGPAHGNGTHTQSAELLFTTAP